MVSGSICVVGCVMWDIFVQRSKRNLLLPRCRSLMLNRLEGVVLK